MLEKQVLNLLFLFIEQALAALKNHPGPLAQWLEQRTHNPLVVGSNPTGATTPSLFRSSVTNVIP